MKKPYVLFALCLALICVLSGCFKKKTPEPVEEPPRIVEPEPEPEPDPEPVPEEDAPPSDYEPEDASLLSSVEDVGLRDVDGAGKNYLFSYDGEDFTAQYTPENWKIVDSYRITNTNDMKVICQALLDAHPIHGQDMTSMRTPDDMAFEWFQHNLAYAFLPDDNPWKQNAKDVDLNPADQGKTFQEMYEDRTGQTFRFDDLLSMLD